MSFFSYPSWAGHVGVNTHTTSKNSSRAHFPSWEGGKDAQNPCSRPRLVAGNILPPSQGLSSYQSTDSSAILDQDYILVMIRKVSNPQGKKGNADSSTINRNSLRLMVSVKDNGIITTIIF